jgi:hypothetical protein
MKAAVGVLVQFTWVPDGARIPAQHRVTCVIFKRLMEHGGVSTAHGLQTRVDSSAYVRLKS